ncbi:MAG: hypothetical protein JOY54_15820 [Acidobacteriaceae bacterium]|nr:hypothetical protein [Acidobacteriaceae bacterium]
MNTIQTIDRLSRDISATVENVRSSFDPEIPAEVALNKYWLSQDLLNRLVDVLSDGSQMQAAALLEERAPNLVSDVVDLLAFTNLLQLGRNAAVKAACEKINEHLIELEYLLCQSA